jgi:amino acid adenylation domain-containing protein
VNRTVIDRFFEVADRFSDDVALRSQGRERTYGELRAEVCDRASGLVDLLPGDSGPCPVALLMPHDGDLVVGILAVMAAGAVAVVLDPESPDEQALNVLVESRAVALVYRHETAEKAARMADGQAREIRVVSLDGLSGAGQASLPSRSPTDPVMLAFTSGTTGGPKGAIITNSVLMNLVRGATNALGIGPGDRLPMLFPVSMAVAAYPMFLPLLNGGTLATLDVRGVGLAPVGKFLQDEAITVVYLSPVVVRFLEDSLRGMDFPDLRLVALGGELVDAEVVQLANQIFAPAHLANGYGTTETGVITLQVEEPTAELGEMPVGFPVDECEVSVLDDRGEEVGADVVGEIAVTSPHVFAGYWGHPELSRRVLEEDPQGRPGWQRYRTGDFGALDSEGRLRVAGRIDSKVKVRGRFVVLGDVEAAVKALPGVRDAVVLAHVRGGVTELVAYVVPEAGEPLNVPSLRAELLAATDGHQVPSTWVFIDEMPSLPNGKTDRRALPAPEVVLGVGDPGGISDFAGNEDWAGLREQLRALWQRLLPVGVIDVDEDFFHLGGDSLLAAQMLVMVERQFGVQIPMAELIEARTVRSLAEVVVRLGADPVQAESIARCVQTGDGANRPTLWFVHDLTGSAFRTQHLAEGLGRDQPLWSFESPLLLGGRPEFTSLDTFAARYLTELRRNQPSGPYWLAGYSFGGICAYEMARQLIAEGENVAFLGIGDVGPGYRGPGWSMRRSPRRPWFGVAQPPSRSAPLMSKCRHYAAMFRASRSGFARHVMVRSGLARVIDPWRFRFDLRMRGRVRPEWRLWYAWELHWRLASRHWDRRWSYPGVIDLFWADSTASNDSTMGWGPLVGGVRVHRVPGEHEQLLDRGAAGPFAASIRRAIDGRLEEGMVDGAELE